MKDKLSFLGCAVISHLLVSVPGGLLGFLWGWFSSQSHPDPMTHELSVLMFTGTVLLGATAPYILYVIISLFRLSKSRFSWRASCFKLSGFYLLSCILVALWLVIARTN